MAVYFSKPNKITPWRSKGCEEAEGERREGEWRGKLGEWQR